MARARTSPTPRTEAHRAARGLPGSSPRRDARAGYRSMRDRTAGWRRPLRRAAVRAARALLAVRPGVALPQRLSRRTLQPLCRCPSRRTLQPRSRLPARTPGLSAPPTPYAAPVPGHPGAGTHPAGYPAPAATRCRRATSAGAPAGRRRRARPAGGGGGGPGYPVRAGHRRGGADVQRARSPAWWPGSVRSWSPRWWPVRRARCQVGLGSTVSGAFAVLAGLAGVAAMALGLVGRRQIRRSEGWRGVTGKGLAMAGIICGAVGVALTVFRPWRRSIDHQGLSAGATMGGGRFDLRAYGGGPPLFVPGFQAARACAYVGSRLRWACPVSLRAGPRRHEPRLCSTFALDREDGSTRPTAGVGL